MKHLVTIALLFCTILNSQVHRAYRQLSQQQRVNVNVELPTTPVLPTEEPTINSLASTLPQTYDDIRFIVLGASIMNSAFFDPTDIENRITTAYPNVNVIVEEEAVGGATIDFLQRNVDNYLSGYSDIAGTTTFCPIHIGGNDVTQDRPYSGLTQADIHEKIADYEYIISAVEAKGFIPIVFDLSFRNYDKNTVWNETAGALPFNTGFINDVALANTPDFTYTDGEPIMQFYKAVYNNYDSWISPDDVHLQGSGLEGFRNRFVDVICGYIINGTIPNRIEKTTHNMLEELAYFDAFYLPPENADQLQSALDTHGNVRIGDGDYSASGDITMSSNQSLIGYYKEDGTFLGVNITIAAGSTNVHLENLSFRDVTANIIFEAGAAITNCTFRTLNYTELQGTNIMLEDCVFEDLARVEVHFNCSSSGYFRNNRFIKIFQQAFTDQVSMIGNDVTPSYGNIELSRNILTNAGNSTYYENLKRHTFIGYDAENFGKDSLTDAAFYFRNMGKLFMFNGNGGSGKGTGQVDIEADEFIINKKVINSNGVSHLRDNTKGITIFDRGEIPQKGANVFDFNGHRKASDTTFLNDVEVPGLISGSDATTLSNIILGDSLTAWKKPEFLDLPNPSGADWSTNRIGKTDQRDEIQSLIDANGIGELDEGVYYIGSSLKLVDGQGIIGKGTGKTIIIGLTDDFPLIDCEDDVTAGDDPNNRFAGQQTNIVYTVAHMTLQGGTHGIYVQPIGNEINYLQITNTPWRHLIFRNQTTAGIEVDGFYGLDNNYFFNLSFVECGVGFLQTPYPNPYASGEWERMTYVDKTQFVNCRWINCGIGVDMRAIRGNNLNSWVNCYWYGNDIAMHNGSSNGLYVANSTVENTTGNAVFDSNASMSFYSVDFKNNTTNTVFNKYSIFAEGCNFNDDIPFNTTRNNNEIYIWNSTINSNVNALNIDKGFFINTIVNNDSGLSKLMVEIKNGQKIDRLNANSNPYPQLLVKQ